MSDHQRALANYRVINWIFLIVFALVLLYFMAIEYAGADIRLPSVYQGIADTESTGLQRSIGQCFRLSFNDAASLNASGISVFVFFVFQFLFRAGIFLRPARTVRWIWVDVIISLSVFCLAFRNFLFLLF